MNLPNKLTLLRVILIPLFMILFLSCGTVGLYLALVTFILAAVTDFFDGQIARRTNSITTFGKLMDPMADKLLTLGALVCFLAADVPYINAWVLIIIIARELIVTGISFKSLFASVTSSVPFSSSEPILTNPTLGFLICIIFSIYIEPIIANCFKNAALDSTLAPPSTNKKQPVSAGIRGAKATRLTPFILLTIRVAPVIKAPVFPALTITSP